MERAKQFWEYWRENANEAKERHEMIFLFLIIAWEALYAASTIWHVEFVGNAIHSEMAERVEVISAVLFTLWAFMWLPFKQHRRQEKKHSDQIKALESRLAPRFTVSGDKSGCVVLDRGDGVHYKYLRLCVETGIQIEQCIGHLIGIEKDGVAVFDHESIELPFAPSDREDCLCKTLHPGVRSHLDVLLILDKYNNIYIATKGLPQNAKTKTGELIFKGNAKYILTVAVSGKDVPTKTVRVMFDWKGDWNNAAIEKIDEK